MSRAVRRFAPSGKPCTCLWCGKGFPPETVWRELGYRTTCCDTPAPDGFDINKHGLIHPRDRPPCACGSTFVNYSLRGEHYPTGRRVGYGDSKHFCTLRCGFAFGERMAQLGQRLVLADDKEQS